MWPAHPSWSYNNHSSDFATWRSLGRCCRVRKLLLQRTTHRSNWSSSVYCLERSRCEIFTMHTWWCRSWVSEPTEWPQPAFPGQRMAKDQSYCSPMGRKTIINPTFILNTQPREKRQDPLSWLSAISCHSPGQDNKMTWWSHAWPTRVHILTNGTTGWLPHRNQSAEPARSQCHQESTFA